MLRTTGYVTSVTKKRLEEQKVVRMLMFALQIKKLKEQPCLNQYSIIVSIQIRRLICFCSQKNAFWVFIVRIWVLLVRNLGLFEIAEWEVCMGLLNTDILAGNAARQ